MRQRLQKVIAQAGAASRREAERLIEAGRVTVNGQVAEIGQSADPDVDSILIDDRPLPKAQKKIYMLLNKPVGYVTTARDPEGRPTVLDLLPQDGERVFPVGRLDLTTEGLLLLTNDGDLSYRLTHPRHEIEKTYLVRVRGLVSREGCDKLQKGIRLEDGWTAPAKVSALRHTGRNTWFELTLHEGRNRQVRRMCEAIGHSVIRLKRIGFAFLDLQGLAAGQCRPLTDDEVRRLKALC